MQIHGYIEEKNANNSVLPNTPERYTIQLERVELFKHLGVVVSSDLSCSNHITSICAKAKRILGLLYRRYYNHVEGDVIK